MCFSKPWSIAHDSEVPSQLNIKPKSCTQQLQVSMVFLHLHLLGEGFLKNFSAISNSSTPIPLGEKLLLSSLLSLSMKASVYLAQRYFSLVLWSLILVMACMNLKCWIRQCLAQTSRTATCENSGKTWWGKDGSLGESKYSVIPWEHLLLSDFSRVRLCAIPQTAAHQAPPSLGFSRQEHWSGLPFPSPMHESEKWKSSRSVMSDPQRPHGLQPSKLLCPWDFPGKSTGVGYT